MIQESFNWLRQCILSSWTSFHLNCCYTLIELFETQFKNWDDCPSMVDDLKIAIREKTISIMVEV